MTDLKYSIIDIANHSGLSKSTVSRVITGNGYTSPEAREKVLKAVEELQFTPNGLARAMVLQRTNTIGVIIYRQHYPIASHPFYGKILDAILTAAEALNYSVFVSTDKEMSQRSADFMLEKRVDGLIVISRISDEMVKYIHKFDIPYLMINRHVEDNVVQIYNDDRKGGQLAANHLLALGHRDIAVIAGPQDMNHSHHLRFDSFKRQVEVAGLKLTEAFTINSQTTNFEDGYELLSQLWERSHKKPTAIFATSDMLALGAMRALADKGIRIPQDVSVIGFDNIDYADYAFPPLTTIHVEKWNMGYDAVTILDQLIRKQQAPSGKLAYQPTIVKRASTDICPRKI